MLEHQLDVVRYNVWKLNRGEQSSLLFSCLLGGRTLGSAGVWNKKYPCYQVDFLFNKEGKLRYAGEVRDFPQELLRRYSSGSFCVALNTPAFLAATQGLAKPEFREERIVGVDYPEDILLIVKERLASTATEYNRRFGFTLENAYF